MDLQLEKFLKKDQESNNCTQCVFVIPTYEISLNSSHLPQNKTELLDFLKEKQARQFHEPLYVSRGDTPPFDERFIGFGMTRKTQVYEMYVAGYSFYLLNNVFTSHWGFQN